MSSPPNDATPAPHPGLEKNTSHDRNRIIYVEGVPIGPDYRFSHGKRLTRFQRRLAVKYLMERDGRKCQLGNDELPIDPSTGLVIADIDHIDGNRMNHLASNLRLACSPHNSRAQYVQARMGAMTPTAQTVGEIKTQGVGVGAATPTDRRILELSRGYERAFRTFYFRSVLDAYKNNEICEPDTLRRRARNETGCSKSASYSYEERLIGTRGDKSFPLYIDRDAVTGISFLRFTNPACYKMSLEQIEDLYPWRGFLQKQTGIELS